MTSIDKNVAETCLEEFIKYGRRYNLKVSHDIPDRRTNLGIRFTMESNQNTLSMELKYETYLEGMMKMVAEQIADRGNTNLVKAISDICPSIDLQVESYGGNLFDIQYTITEYQKNMTSKAYQGSLFKHKEFAEQLKTKYEQKTGKKLEELFASDNKSEFSDYLQLGLASFTIPQKFILAAERK